MIKGIHHVGIRVRDAAKATAFYVDFIGLRIDPRKPNWLTLPNGQSIHLMLANDASNDGRDIKDLARHVALHVTSLEAITALLIEGGYEPFQTELTPSSGARPARRPLTDTQDLTFGIGTVLVEDPDGNILELIDPNRGIFGAIG